MSIDAEFISRKDFNNKFKNYLRDFYVYQFKNQNIDFYDTGSFSRSRMVAVIIACAIDKSIRMEDFFKVKMSDMDFSDNSVSITITEKSTGMTNKNVKRIVVINKPLSEMFRYLYTADDAAYFITGNTAPFSKVGKEKIDREAESFQKLFRSHVTEEELYHYWGQVYLNETNEAITTGTFRNDSLRLRNLINQMADVKWSDGCRVDHISGSLSGEKDSCVKCVTADTRELSYNPFHLLYRYCNRYSNSGIDYFNVIFALVMYFNIDKDVVYVSDDYSHPIRSRECDRYFKDNAAKLFSIASSSIDGKRWDELTLWQKRRYACKEVSGFVNEGYDVLKNAVFNEYRKRYPRDKIKEGKKLTKVHFDVLNSFRTKFFDEKWEAFAYLITNRKRIKFNGTDFEFVDSKYVEKGFLYIAISRFLECGEKQFTNIMRDIVKTGVLNETKKLTVYCNRLGNRDNVRMIESVLDQYTKSNFEIFKVIEDSYCLSCRDSVDEKVLMEDISAIILEMAEKGIICESGEFILQCKINSEVTADKKLIESILKEYKNLQFKLLNTTDNDAEYVYSIRFKSFIGEDKTEKIIEQFSTVLYDIAEAGIAFEIEETRLRLKYSNKKSIEQILNDYSQKGFELVEEVDEYVYSIYYGNDVDNALLNSLKSRLLSDVCKDCNDSDTVYFSLSDYRLKEVLENNSDRIERFSEMVSFFSQTAVLGEVGSYVSDRLPHSKWKLFYKHNYIVRSLNDYNNIELMYAMQNPNPDDHYWVEIECRDALNEYGYQHFVCYPIEIRENVSDGKQYLIYYHPLYRSIASVRIDFIDRVIVGEKAGEHYFKSDIKRAHELIRYTWGLNFGEFYEGNVKSDPHPSKLTFTIRFVTKDKKDGKIKVEKFIKDRIRREVGNFTEKRKATDDDIPTLIEVTVDVVNPWDMLNWIRTYIKRIEGIKIEYNSFMDDVERANKMYILPTPERVSLALKSGENCTVYAKDVDFQPVDSKSERLFNEFYSETFRELGEVLYKFISYKDISGELIEQLKHSYVGEQPSESALQAEYNKYERREKDFADLLCKFATQKQNKYVPIFTLSEAGNSTSIYDLIPLTEIEMQWLQSVLNHKLARAFLTKAEIDSIKKHLSRLSWFDVNQVVLSEQHSDVALERYYDNVKERNFDIESKKLFDDPDFGVIIRKMMQAIKDCKILKIGYQSQAGKNTPDYVFVPYCIEYSKRDNRFRVKAVCQSEDKTTFYSVRMFPIDAIYSYEETGETVSKSLIEDRIREHKTKKKKKQVYPNKGKKYYGVKRKIVILFSESNGVSDRILTEFSCYEKTCIRWGNGRYRMELTYYEYDCNEIVIRLLGYGSLISVSSEDSDDPVVDELKERYQDQMDLYRENTRSREL